MLKSLLARKPLHKLTGDAAAEHGFHKVLGPLNLISMGIGVIVGAGIFVLTGTVASLHAGPAVIFSFIISAVCCGLAGLCYAEFASLIPVSGSAYTYAYATLGEFIAWIIGWDLVLEYLLGASAVAVGWSGYATNLLKGFNIILPAYLTAPTGTMVVDASGATVTAWFNLPAIAILLVMTTLLIFGIKESARFNNVIVILKVSVLLLFIVFGFMYINPANWVPFLPPNTTGHPGDFGLSGVLKGAGMIFFAYIGFDVVAATAQEARNPQRDMPIGILGSLAACTILYILVAVVLTGLVSYTKLNVAEPIAVALDNIQSGALVWLKPFIKLGAIAGLTSVILVLLMAQPRVFFSMANDGLLPRSFAKLHPRFKTPYVTTISTGSVAMIMAGIFPIDTLGEMVCIGTLMAFTIVCIGVLVLRYRHPELPRKFKTPFVPYVPVLGAVICVYLMTTLGEMTWMRLIIWLLIGLIIYFLYGRRSSRLREKNQTVTGS